MPIETVPYCGLPPLPGEAGWNTDPVLLLALATIAAAYVARAMDVNLPVRRAGWFLGGWAVLTLALVSPLCSLSVALFSAREAQHMVLMLVAAPMIALGRPSILLGRGTAEGPAPSGRRIIASAVVFAVALWIWHVPALYRLTLESTPVYVAMHASMTLAAVWLWADLLDRGADLPAALLASFGSAIQMSLLGGGLTMASRALYGVHATTTQPWGLSPLEDQQLAGMIMWVPGGLVFTVLSVVAVVRLLDASERLPETASMARPVR